MIKTIIRQVFDSSRLLRRNVESFAISNRTRKSRLYCVGTAKSGTHSIGAMFDPSVHSQHEPTDTEMIEYIIKAYSGELSESKVKSFLSIRDKKLCLDIDSSQLNFFFLKEILDEFEDALFLLTIRDCYSWLDSFINHSLGRSASASWVRLRELRFEADTSQHPPEEQALLERGLYTLDGYLSYWAKHNSKVLDLVPKDKLLVVRTDRISQKACEIADFCNLDRSTIIQEKTHSFKNSHKHHILDLIEKNYLETKVQQHCAQLMTTFFPGISSIEDAFL